jgi:hypothetical protein
MQVNNQKQNVSFSALTIDKSVKRKAPLYVKEALTEALPELDTLTKDVNVNVSLGRKNDILIFNADASKKKVGWFKSLIEIPEGQAMKYVDGDSINPDLKPTAKNIVVQVQKAINQAIENLGDWREKNPVIRTNRELSKYTK